MTQLDAAHELATKLVADAGPRLEEIVTEEDAKFQLISRMLTEVLGWSHADVSNERKNENGFSDYVVSHLGHPAYLIEAKRLGAIGIASTATKRSLYRISGPALKPSLDGIRQAASYCAPDGIQLALVTDGICWIFFKPFIPGEITLPKTRSCFRRFKPFWMILQSFMS